MTNKITLKDLNNLVDLLRHITSDYNEIYQISQAYGGYKLVKLLNNGEKKDISKGFISKKELYSQIEMYINGFESKE